LWHFFLTKNFCPPFIHSDSLEKQTAYNQSLKNAMKKKMKNACAGIMLSLLIPAFIGGQFILTDKKSTAHEQQMLKQKTSNDIDMEQAYSIVP